ncbi:MAG: glycoside hydrolase family 127 protein, partial [Candidatus Brocadiia bacterium]|nr:glycoside hydrolase family 127 protein [Candidatus Brocadiia bacterium]
PDHPGVPDTLELQERARLALHCLTETTDPQADYEPYYVVRLCERPPAMYHSSWHGSTLAKYIEMAPLMRIISGSEQNRQVERRWTEVALKMQGPDGLIYTPARGRPWADQELGGTFENFGVKIEGDQYITAFGNGRMLSAMSLLAQRDGGPLWRDAARRLVDGLVELAVDAGDVAYFWPTVLFSKKGGPPDGRVRTPYINSESSRVPHGLVHAYRLLGYEPALILAGKVINYLRRYFYGPDGAFHSTPGNPHKAHFHAHSHGLLAMMEYALTADDQELMEFVVRSFQWAIDAGANWQERGWEEIVKTRGASLVGYFSTFLNSDQAHSSEICEVSDMIALALKLSEAGIGDYWDDADRWLRNMLVEGQLTSTDWVDDLPETGFPPDQNPYRTTERVAERNLGAFAGWPAANDWAIRDAYGTMQCCTVNGARALYWIWDSALRHQGGKLRVNLLLNRASPWADVDSHIPYRGQVDVRVKQPVGLEIRIPEWVAPRETRCQVNGEERSLAWDGRYARVGRVKPDETATLSFPISERTDVVNIEKRAYTLVRKGNEVVSIDPPGRYYPFYQREHYRSNTTRWRTIERFVCRERIPIL